MTEFEEAQKRARELDKLYPEFYHAVNLRYKIVRWRKPEQ